VPLSCVLHDEVQTSEAGHLILYLTQQLAF
jgi:hypothetical protein